LSNWITFTKKNIRKSLVVIYIQTRFECLYRKTSLPQYAENAKEDTDGRMILRDNFDAIFTKYPETLFGEDAGAIGDVNQGLEGMHMVLYA
jgi:hypothetical protein